MAELDDFDKLPPKQFADRMLNRAIDNRYLFLSGLCGMTLPFMFYGGGVEVQGRALGGLLIVVWWLLTHDPLCALFGTLWLGGMVVYKLTTDKRAHSQSFGWPWLKLCGFGFKLGSFIQVSALNAAGYLLLAVDPAFGAMLLASGIGWACDFYMGWWTRRKEVIAYRDAQHEMANRRSAYTRGW